MFIGSIACICLHLTSVMLKNILFTFNYINGYMTTNGDFGVP